jgi:predicted RNase H-like nuclease
MNAIGGVDGCPAGWLLLRQDSDGTISSAIHGSAADLFATSDCRLLMIDIPIGLAEKGPRQCDVEARRLLGPRRNSVFPTPVRAALAGTTYAEACELSRASCGKALSRQTFAILDRIRDVDAALRDSSALRARVREVHPEVCFYFWNGSRPMEHAKKSAQGAWDRRRLIDRAFGADVFDGVRASHRSKLVADDDILDAFAALWTAGRVMRGEARTVPAVPGRDSYGLPMEMVA